ncbi:hypothetical protein FRX31_013902 [Thalictrum thalictroides]|uniref:Uncharacterized protein n=1 Tax=Thalictrum thalictroides TaxID=46969 RepID=A0A7J6WGQ6_THATH|nr:hypothetical protein FRX31_013902 [Thalictrum thalictroides]
MGQMIKLFHFFPRDPPNKVGLESRVKNDYPCSLYWGSRRLFTLLQPIQIPNRISLREVQKLPFYSGGRSTTSTDADAVPSS